MVVLFLGLVDKDAPGTANRSRGTRLGMYLLDDQSVGGRATLNVEAFRACSSRKRRRQREKVELVILLVAELGRPVLETRVAPGQ